MQLSKAMDILFAEASDLKSLAKISSLSPATFYRYANLRGLDLSGQDLSGMNFDWSDLRGANLENSSFTEGSFNNALLSEEYTGLKDQFDCYPSDFENKFARKLQIFGRFRNGIFNDFFENLGLRFSTIASDLEMSTATLRKVRTGQIVSTDTIFNVWNAFCDPALPYAGSDVESDFLTDLSTQPSLQLGEYTGEGKFVPLDRKSFLEAVKNFEFYSELSPQRFHDSDGVFAYQERPSVLKDLIEFYERHGYVRFFQYPTPMAYYIAKDHTSSVG